MAGATPLEPSSRSTTLEYPPRPQSWVLQSQRQAKLPSSSQAQPQQHPITADQIRFQMMMQRAIANQWHQQGIDRIMQSVAHALLGSPYVEGLLDQAPTETLITSLMALTVCCLWKQCWRSPGASPFQDYSHTTFAEHIEDQRYWDGQLNGYCSRLHYFSSWIADNERRGMCMMLPKSSGGSR